LAPLYSPEAALKVEKSIWLYLIYAIEAVLAPNAVYLRWIRPENSITFDAEDLVIETA
jgi:hypothetical protein